MLIDLRQDPDGEDHAGLIAVSSSSLITALNLYGLNALNMSSVYCLAKYLFTEKRVLTAEGVHASYADTLKELARSFQSLVQPKK